MSVDRIKRMSAAASKLFFRPNWMGVKAKLKIRFRMKGKAMAKPTSFPKYITKTFPKEMNISI